ncbi:MAG: hypothetical protein JWN78_1131 [Bacteroidota bacterium]|nr:hypothetical protein [Bacteroidota bacterium]
MKETKNKYLFGAKLSFLNGKDIKVKIVETSGTVIEGVVTSYNRGGYSAKGETILAGAAITNSVGLNKIAIENIDKLFYN